MNVKLLQLSHSSAVWSIVGNMPHCGVYLLPIKSVMLDITIGTVKKVIHFNDENH